MDRAKIIRDFVEKTFFFVEGGLADGDSLLSRGIIDSTGVLEVVGFLENEFGIEVADKEIVPENLDSIANIAAFVERKSA